MKLHEEISIRWIVLYMCFLASISGGSYSREEPAVMYGFSKDSVIIHQSVTNFEDSLRTALEGSYFRAHAAEHKK